LFIHGGERKLSGKYSIAVAVKTAYLSEQSDPSRHQYVFAYTITIENTNAMRPCQRNNACTVGDTNARIATAPTLVTVTMMMLMMLMTSTSTR